MFYRAYAYYNRAITLLNLDLDSEKIYSLQQLEHQHPLTFKDLDAALQDLNRGLTINPRDNYAANLKFVDRRNAKGMIKSQLSDSEILHVVATHPTIDILKLLSESDHDPYRLGRELGITYRALYRCSCLG